jgi:hypothetical protein
MHWGSWQRWALTIDNWVGFILGCWCDAHPPILIDYSCFTSRDWFFHSSGSLSPTTCCHWGIKHSYTVMFHPWTALLLRQRRNCKQVLL